MGKAILKNPSCFLWHLKSSDPPVVSLFSLVIYTPYELKSIALGKEKSTPKKM
jgi:hypothetical protein